MAGKKSKKYRKPRLEKTELVKHPGPSAFSKALAYRKRGKKKPLYHVREGLAAREKEITDFLHGKGLNIAKVYVLEAKGRTFIVTKRFGTSFSDLLKAKPKANTVGDCLTESPTRAKALNHKVAMQLAQLVGKMHGLGVTHGHLHKGNISWDGKKVGLLDFKAAMRQPIERLRSAEELSPRQKLDLTYFSQLLEIQLGFGIKKQEPYFKVLIGHYPVSKKKKKAFMAFIGKEYFLE